MILFRERQLNVFAAVPKRGYVVGGCSQANRDPSMSILLILPLILYPTIHQANEDHTVHFSRHLSECETPLLICPTVRTPSLSLLSPKTLNPNPHPLHSTLPSSFPSLPPKHTPRGKKPPTYLASPVPNPHKQTKLDRPNQTTVSHLALLPLDILSYTTPSSKSKTGCVVGNTWARDGKNVFLAVDDAAVAVAVAIGFL